MTFSIVIPVYNALPFLRECLDSLLSQSFRDWRAICVDDGSVDGSGEVLDQYATNDHRFLVFHQKNQGVSASRNLALDQIKDGWTLFLDADDAFVPWALEDLESLIAREPNADFYVFKPQLVTEMSQPLPVRDARGRIERLVISNPAAAQVAYARLYTGLLAWGACHRSAFLRDIRFTKYPNGEDSIFGYECLTHAREIVLSEEVLYRYRKPREGSANTPTLRNLKSCCDNVVEWHRITRAWPYRDCLYKITRRKWKFQLCVVVYPILLKLDRSGKRAGKKIFLDYLRQQIDLVPENFSCWTRLWARTSVLVHSLIPFHVFIYWPYRVRLAALKIPGIRIAVQRLRQIGSNK